MIDNLNSGGHMVVGTTYVEFVLWCSSKLFSFVELESNFIKIRIKKPNFPLSSEPAN
jgi:hypothetical protein